MQYKTSPEYALIKKNANWKTLGKHRLVAYKRQVVTCLMQRLNLRRNPKTIWHLGENRVGLLATTHRQATETCCLPSVSFFAVLLVYFVNVDWLQSLLMIDNLHLMVNYDETFSYFIDKLWMKQYLFHKLHLDEANLFHK